MKLSDQIHHDFLSEDTRKSTIHKISYDYIVDMIERISELEEKAAKYDALMAVFNTKEAINDLYESYVEHLREKE